MIPRVSSPENGPESAAALIFVHSGPSANERDLFGNPIIHPPNFPTLHVGQMLVSGCGKPQLGPQAYEIAVALDTVLENEDPAQLAQASELIDAQHNAGDLSSAEAQQLMGLVEMGRADNWSGARAKLRRLLSDQTDW